MLNAACFELTACDSDFAPSAPLLCCSTVLRMNASPRLQVPCAPPSSKQVRLSSGRYASADASQNARPDDNDDNDNE